MGVFSENYFDLLSEANAIKKATRVTNYGVK